MLDSKSYTVCPKHHRWTDIYRKDGSESHRPCPECTSLSATPCCCYQVSSIARCAPCNVHGDHEHCKAKR